MRWRPAPGYQGFEVSDAGMVRDARRNLLPQSPSNRSDSGYARVRIRGKNVRVHRLVLLAFRGAPPSDRHHAAHGAGGKLDNRLRNLAWKLPADNEADKRAHGTASRGGRNRLPSPQIVGRVLAAVRRGNSFRSVAYRYGLHRSSVSRYARGIRRRIARPLSRGGA